MVRDTRPIVWIKAARRAFDEFPEAAQDEIFDALSLAAEGQKSALAKPMKGFGAGVFEIALRHRGDAFRTIYALHLGEAIWVIHAFQKKSKSGISTPRHEIETIRSRLARLKEMSK